MALPDKINTLPTWSSKDSNKWADFIELSCLNNSDHLISIDDMLDHYSDERPDDLERGSQEHSAKYDQIVSEMYNYFDLIKFRSETLGDYYPFELDENRSITLKNDLNIPQLFYLFLLFSSNVFLFDGTTSYALTHAFEDLSSTILHSISSPLAITQVFGTSRDGDDRVSYKGNLRKRISALADNICAVTSKSFDADSMYDVSGGDGGIDLISFIPLDDMPFIPVSFAQCACTYDRWEEKQNSISSERWGRRFGNLAPYLQFTFIPFYFRRANGEFENPTRILTCIMDRHRILKIARNNDNTFNEFAKHSIYEKVYSIAVT
jgi:hypothetical protein